MTKNKNTKNKISDAEIRRLVVERLRTLPSGKQVSIGDEGSFTKEELINKVESEDFIGEKLIEVELEFLRSLKEGVFFDEFSDEKDAPHN